MKYIKNSKGFTLIELMATLAILVLIVLIAVPAVGSIINNAEESAEANSIKMIEKAGSLADVGGLEHDGEDTYDVTTLIEAGYVDMDASDDLAEGYVVKVGSGNAYEYNGAGVPDGDLVDSLPIPSADEFEFLSYADTLMDGLGVDEAGLISYFNDNVENAERAVVEELNRSIGTNQLYLSVLEFELEQQEYIRDVGMNAVILTGYNGAEKEIEIPSEIDGVPILAILPMGWDGVERVRLPETLPSLSYANAYGYDIIEAHKSSLFWRYSQAIYDNGGWIGHDADTLEDALSSLYSVDNFVGID